MFKSYLKIATRNLLKRKIYSLINVLGLAIGMAVCLLIVLYIKGELNYDQSQENGDNIYRVVVERKYPGRSTSYSFIPRSYAGAIKQECPEVKEVVRIFNFLGIGNFQLKYEDKSFEESNVFFADSTFFNVFTTDFLAGNSEKALHQPNTIVLTKTSAIKYFGSVDNAVGKILQPEGNNQPPLTVSAVCKDWPENSHFTFDMLISTSGRNDFNDINFVNFAAHTYLLLHEKADYASVESKFPGIIEKYAAGNIEQLFVVSFKQFQDAGNGYKYYLQPLKKIHLTSHLEGELKPNGSLTAIYIFSMVAFFILLIACINFINLSTARSAERAKEVGIRKTFGSEKKMLISQFLTESALVSFVGMILSISLAFLLLGIFNRISGKSLQLQELFNFSSILVLFTFTLVIGLIAGLYPAFVLSSFRPIQVLRGNFKSGSFGLALRNGLVIFQFAISVILIICTIVVNSQMNFMTSDNLGFDKEHVVIVERTDLLAGNTKAFKDELKKISGIENVSGASAFPGLNFFGTSWQESGSNEPMTGRGIIVDDQYLATMGLELSDGRFFSKEFQTDTFAVIINEKAVSEMGLKDPINARVTTPDAFFNAPDGAQIVYTVIGVVKDFHYQSLHQPIIPLVFTNAARFNDEQFITAVRIKGKNLKSTIEGMEVTWKKFVKDRNFKYEFLDKTIEAMYHAESTTQKIFSFFSALAIFIACLGLLGLAAYSTQQRTREIGIRKVLGASVSNITGLLSKDFTKLVLLSLMIAFPTAWWVMNKWLEDFTYRIKIEWWMFVLAGSLAFLIALITISFQTIKAALANPVHSLRTE
jgi:putative ABC transport system permease protein